nr:retrovirus-related Pol polyprotein from transposon TNT 1-94 [Tanacetum cinerariifolium]
CAVSLEGEDKFPKDTKEEVKKKIMAKAHSAILLSITNEVLREVVDQTTASELWDKLWHSKSRNSGKVKCYRCKEKGHIKKDSPQKKENSKGESSNSGSAAMVQDGSDDGDFVKLGDDVVLSIKGSKIVHIKMHDGIVRKFDCWFVPGLKKNLISLGTLAKNGLKYHGEGHFSDRNGGGIPNGVAERMNQTLMARARCMRIFAGLSKQFWAEAVNTTIYLVNRSPSTAIGLKMPQKRSNCRILEIITQWKISGLAKSREKLK